VITESASVPRAPDTSGELRRRIVQLADAASLELTAGAEAPVAALAAELPPGAIVYVAHPPKATLEDVVHASLAVEEAGLRACPHLVARRIDDRDALQSACERLAGAGVDRALVVAGDRDRPEGPYGSALDLLRTDLLRQHGLTHVGVAGHPEGHRAIGQTVLWRALHDKQVVAKRTGLEMHVVTQFGFDPAALVAWDGCLPEHGINLPVHVGMAGPASLPQLIAYAMQCGVGASLRGALQSMAAMRNVAGLATSPDQMLARIAQQAGSAATRIAGVHFYSFGGAVATARWVRAVAAGRFEMSPGAGGFALLD
jgi:methylenetetrahydrofolate reductase (NADPH)